MDLGLNPDGIPDRRRETTGYVNVIFKQVATSPRAQRKRGLDNEGENAQETRRIVMEFGRYSKENKDASLFWACDNLVVTVVSVVSKKTRREREKNHWNLTTTKAPRSINENCI